MLEVAKLEEVDGVWIPKEVHCKSKSDHANGDSTQTKTVYNITSAQINPAHDAMGSFEIRDFRNGAYVMIDPGVGKRYSASSGRENTWQDGKVVDKDGKVIMDTKAGN